LAATTWHRTRSLEEYKNHIEERAKRAFRSAAKGTAIVVASAVGAPVASLLAVAMTIAFYSTVIKGHRLEDQTIQYVAVRSGEHWCVAESKDGSSSSERRGPFTVRALIGRNVHHEGRELKVSGASHDPSLGNVLMLSGLLERPVLGTCLVGEPPGGETSSQSDGGRG
jgi:hypothetical protein